MSTATRTVIAKGSAKVGKTGTERHPIVRYQHVEADGRVWTSWQFDCSCACTSLKRNAKGKAHTFTDLPANCGGVR
jgi:hypothetical protein